MSGRAYFGQSREVNSILHLQRTIGNQAVQRMLQTNAEELEVGLASPASPRFAHDFSQIPLHPKSPVNVQAKLTVGSPGDIYKQEADRVSEQVMRIPEPQLQRACGGGCPKSLIEQPGQEHERLQTKRVQASDRGQIAAPPIVHEVLAAPGHALDTATRTFMEPRFGHDFSHVRVHTDERAAESAEALKARAYAVGQHVVLGSGQPLPETVSGRRLLAHELAHVVQADAAASNPARLFSPVEALEREARQVAASIRGGGAVPPIHGLAQTPSVPLREGPDDPGAPTFGNLPRDRPEFAGSRRVEIVNEGGKWKEIASGRSFERRTPKGRYDFVIQDGRIWAVRSAGPFGHTEAAQGGRVTWAGMVTFNSSGALKSWDNASGHYLPTGSFAENAARAHPKLPIDKFVVAFRGPMTLTGGRQQGPQLPVFQPDTKPPANAPAVAVSTVSAPKEQPPKVPTTTATMPKLTSPTAYRRELAKAIAQSASSVTKGNRLTQRLLGYLAAWGALQNALGALALIDSMTKLLAHGTALPAEQREADQLLRQSQEAIKEAEEATGDISLFGWTAFTGEALRNEDAEALSAIDDTLTKMRRPLEEASEQLQGLSDELLRSAHSLRVEQLKQLVQILMPSLGGTGGNAIAFSLHRSLELLGGAVQASATNFATASQTLSYWGHQLKALEDSANDAAWYVWRKRAAERLQVQKSLEAAKQFRSEAPVVESEKERQSREFMNRLQDPNTLNRAQ